jgi:antitoxin ParD1/3/4
MADPRKISVTLTPDEQADLSAAVENGSYASASEIVHEAITAWRLGHTLTGQERTRLGELWDEGKQGGERRDFDIERILASARGRLGEAAAE